MADAGAHKIKRLINTPTKRLGTLLKRLSNQLGNVSGPEGTVPDSTYSTIDDLRRYYRHLSRQVRAVHTSSPHKRQVLAALRRMDSGLSSYASGLKAGAGADAPKLLANGYHQTSRAIKDLARAEKRLS